MKKLFKTMISASLLLGSLLTFNGCITFSPDSSGSSKITDGTYTRLENWSEIPSSLIGEYTKTPNQPAVGLTVIVEGTSLKVSQTNNTTFKDYTYTLNGSKIVLSLDGTIVEETITAQMAYGKGEATSAWIYETGVITLEYKVVYVDGDYANTGYTRTVAFTK
jgi:hypothetical protein